MNKTLKSMIIATSLLLTSVVVLNASLDSKTDTLSDLGEPDFVLLAEVETLVADPEEATLYLNKNE